MIDQGAKIGRFVVVRELGRGGMGAVYAAHDPQLDRQVALKVMRDATGEEEDRIRMLREGQAMARVTHPNVITVYEVGTEGGSVFLAQELLDGGTLGEWLGTQRSQPAIVDKFIAAGRGLAAAHAAGLVHRDFKPDNVLLGKDGRVRVADFGLARAAGTIFEGLAVTTKGGGPPVANIDVTKSPMSPLTRTGAVMGTPMFMAPEQHKGERADAASDQFAFCVSLYHALYKAWPFAGKSAPALADAVIDGRLEPEPKGAGVSARLRKIILRGLATDPGARFPSMDALLAELEREVRPPQKSRAPWLIGLVVLALGAAGAAAFIVLTHKNTDKQVVVMPPPPKDAEPMTSERSIAWLTGAIDRGQLGDAIDKYDLKTDVKLKDNDPVQAAIAEAASAYMRVLKGDLKEAEAKVVEATNHAATDPVATACVDLAEASLALARGKLEAASEGSGRCATALAQPAPVLAAICYQIHGDALASLGDGAAARKAYEAGLAIAKQQKSDERTSTLQLALAQLELDEQHPERAAELANAILGECSERGAVGCEVNARIVLARVKSLEDAHAAVDVLAAVKPATIEAFPVKTMHAIAYGKATGDLDEAGEDQMPGLDRIEKARAQAEVKDFVGLMLEAKLARVRVLLIHDTEGAEAEYKALVKQARSAHYERIAHLAEQAFDELSAQPRDMLSVDGGLPAVPPGSP